MTCPVSIVGCSYVCFSCVASGLERSGAARRWRAALRSPIREIPGGLDASGAPGFWQNFITYRYTLVPYHTILIAGDEIASVLSAAIVKHKSLVQLQLIAAAKAIQAAQST